MEDSFPYQPVAFKISSPRGFLGCLSQLELESCWKGWEGSVCCVLLWPGGRQGDRQGHHSPRANSVLALEAAEHQFESGLVCVSLGIV